MGSTYMAVEVSAPDVLRVVQRTISEPAGGQVRIRVEACGVCHSDAATVQGDFPGLKLPRVPGHEVVGRIEQIGPVGCFRLRREASETISARFARRIR